MNDPQTPAAAVTAQPSAPAQPAAQPQTDDGYERVPREQYQTLMRNNERVRGMEPFFQKASQYGWKKPEDLETWGELAKFAKDNGMDPQKFMRSFQKEQPEQAHERPPGFDIEAVKKELGGQFVSKDELALERATGKHEMAQEKHNAAVSKAVESLAGDLPFPKAVVSRAVAGFLADPAYYRTYPQGHPLADRALMPHDEESLKPIIAAVKKELSEAAGDSLAAMGDAALKGKKLSTPAGSTQSTASKPPSKADQERRPGNLPPKAAVEAEYAKRRAARSGGPVSSMGG